MIYCRQYDPTIQWWMMPPSSPGDPRGTFGGLWADGYALYISGKGYAYDVSNIGNQFDNNSDTYASGQQPITDEIVLITDAGAPGYVGCPAVGHLRNGAVNPADVDGACTLFLSGRAIWRARGELQWNVWIGQANPWLTGNR
jgi:hypothetical protein